MAEKLGVDDLELTRFMKLLKKSTEAMEGLRKALSDAEVTGLGTDDLDGACEEFQGDWKYGTEQIGKQTEELAEIVGQSKESYAEVDKALDRAMEKARGKTDKGGGAK